MATYNFTAVTWQNTVVDGSIEAKNLKAAQNIILARYAYPVTLHKKVPKFLEFIYAEAGTTKMKPDDLAGFLLLLGEMLKSGSSITEVLTTMARSSEKTTSAMAKALHLRIIEGDDLAQAFHHARKMMGHDFGDFVRVGVEGGSIGSVIVNLSEHINTEQQAKKKVRGALSYPLMMVGMTFVISIFLFTQTVPKIVESVLSMMENGELPMMTQIAIGISDFLVTKGPMLLAIIAVVAAVLVYLLKRPFNFQWHKFQVGIPYVGTIITNQNMSSFFRSFGIAVGAGMPIAAGMRTAAGGINNKYIRAEMVHAADEVEHNGKTLKDALEECPFITGIEVSSMDTGIRSSQVQKMSNFVANIKDINNDQKIKNFTTVINPILLSVIGALVGCIMYAVYGPIFSLMQGMGAG